MASPLCPSDSPDTRSQAHNKEWITCQWSAHRIRIKAISLVRCHAEAVLQLIVSAKVILILRGSICKSSRSSANIGLCAVLQAQTGVQRGQNIPELQMRAPEELWRAAGMRSAGHLMHRSPVSSPSWLSRGTRLGCWKGEPSPFMP